MSSCDDELVGAVVLTVPESFVQQSLRSIASGGLGDGMLAGGNIVSLLPLLTIVDQLLDEEAAAAPISAATEAGVIG